MGISSRASVLCVAAACALLVGACGGDDSSSSSGSGGSSSSSSSSSSDSGGVPGNSAGKDMVIGGAKGEAATKAAKASVKTFGGPVDAPTGKTIGLVNITGQSEAAQR